MSHYTEILPDGSRRVVHYNPHHDGPVSDRITLSNRARWLQRQLKRTPGNTSLQKRLADTHRQINQLLSPDPRGPSPHCKHARNRASGTALERSHQFKDSTGQLEPAPLSVSQLRTPHPSAAAPVA